MTPEQIALITLACLCVPLGLMLWNAIETFKTIKERNASEKVAPKRLPKASTKPRNVKAQRTRLTDRDEKGRFVKRERGDAI